MPEEFLHGIEVTEVENGLRPIQTVKSSLVGFVGTAPDADATLFPLNKPVLISGPRMAATLGADGTLADAYAAIYAQGVNIAIVVRVAEGADVAETRSNVVGSAATGTGVWALTHARNLLGQTPRILAAPGFTSTPAADPASPVTLGLIAVANRLRACVWADGPGTNEADALLDRAKYGSDRLMIIDPAVLVWDTATNAYVTRPGSAFGAGAMSARDAAKGFWWSPSNQVLQPNCRRGNPRPPGHGPCRDPVHRRMCQRGPAARLTRPGGQRVCHHPPTRGTVSEAIPADQPSPYGRSHTLQGAATKR